MWASLTQRTAGIAVLAALGAGVALGASPAGSPTVKASDSLLSTQILVSPKGLTLYHFLPETKGTIKCSGACAILWPPLVVPAGVKPVGGPGILAAKLGTIKRPDGRIQVTYNGLALYRDYYDKPGQLNGQGEQGKWFAVTPAGKVTKASVPAPESNPAPASPQAATPQPAPAQGAPVPQPPPLQCVVDDVCIPPPSQ